MIDEEILDSFNKLNKEHADLLLQIVSANLHTMDSKITRETIERALIALHKNFGGFDEALMSYVPED